MYFKFFKLWNFWQKSILYNIYVRVLTVQIQCVLFNKIL